MLTIRRTPAFLRWLDNLRDRHAAAIVMKRLERLVIGNAGDVKHVGEGVSELRIDYGPGYRVDFLTQGAELVVILAGGIKATQNADIQQALKFARIIRTSP